MAQESSASASAIEILLDVMRRRRNIRRFKPDPVPEEYIDAIVEAARLAPSGANSQPWEIIVVRDPERKRRIAEIFVEASKKGREVDPKFPGVTESINQTKFIGAPVLLAFCGDPRLKAAYPGHGFRDSIFCVSVGAAMEHMHLAANALGLGMGWGTISQFSEAAVGELLGVRPPLIVKEVFALGLPEADPPAHYRRDRANIVHNERLDNSKIRTDEEIERLISSRRTVDIYSGGNPDARR